MTYANEKQLPHLLVGSGLDRGASPFSWRAVMSIPVSTSLTS